MPATPAVLPTQRFRGAITPVAAPPAELPGAGAGLDVELERDYGTGRVWLALRDPRTLHVSWDLPAMAHGQPVSLRLFLGEPPARLLQELTPAAGARSVFLPATIAGGLYSVEVGFQGAEGGWHSIATARPVRAPAPVAAESPVGEVQFVTLPVSEESDPASGERVAPAPVPGPAAAPAEEAPEQAVGLPVPAPIAPEPAPVPGPQSLPSSPPAAGPPPRPVAPLPAGRVIADLPGPPEPVPPPSPGPERSRAPGPLSLPPAGSHGGGDAGGAALATPELPAFHSEMGRTREMWGAPSPPWTAAQEAAMGVVIDGLASLPATPGSLAPAAPERPTPHGEQAGVPPGSAVPPPRPAVPNREEGLPSSGAVAGSRPAAPRAFWFNINAELIVYGATEPDARVVIDGHVVALRPDGTFSLRFALPDGDYQLSAVATAADAHDERSAMLRFARHTAYRGKVDRHPTDPALRPPASPGGGD